jgi:Outer membrane protein beta-barrel domain
MKQHLHVIVRKCALSLIALALAQTTFSQIGIFNELEAGVTFGPSNFLGDLGGTKGRGMGFLKDNNIAKTKFIVGAHLTGYINPLIGVRLALNYGTLTGSDEVIKGQGGLEEYRKFRNSDFRSRLFEAFVAAEVYPSVFLEYDPEDLYHKIRPYGLVGVGVFNFNPQGTDPLTGNYVNLKTLSTEGQGFAEYPNRKVYKTTQLNIPMGVGVKYFVSDNTSISLEVVHRKTFTDYIDDVSTTYIDPNLFDQYFGVGSQKAQLARRMANKTDQGSSTSAGFGPGDKRGTATNKDAYYSFGFKVSFRLGTGDGTKDYKSIKCPAMRF